jgi:hypothetical protein
MLAGSPPKKALAESVRQAATSLEREALRGSMANNGQEDEKRLLTKMRTFDRFLLAFAETAGVDALLTTYDNFEKACSKLSLKIKVMNPLDFLSEGGSDEGNN